MLWLLWVYLGGVALVPLGYQAFFWYVKINGQSPIRVSEVLASLGIGLLFGIAWPGIVGLGLFNLITKGQIF